MIVKVYPKWLLQQLSAYLKYKKEQTVLNFKQWLLVRCTHTRQAEINDLYFVVGELLVNGPCPPLHLSLLSVPSDISLGVCILFNFPHIWAQWQNLEPGLANKTSSLVVCVNWVTMDEPKLTAWCCSSCTFLAISYIVTSLSYSNQEVFFWCVFVLCLLVSEPSWVCQSQLWFFSPSSSLCVSSAICSSPPNPEVWTMDCRCEHQVQSETFC